MTLKIVGEPKQGQKVDSFYAVVAISPEGNEGIAGAKMHDNWIPLAAGSEELIKKAAEKFVPALVEADPTYKFEIRKYGPFEVLRTYATGN